MDGGIFVFLGGKAIGRWGRLEACVFWSHFYEVAHSGYQCARARKQSRAGRWRRRRRRSGKLRGVEFEDLRADGYDEEHVDDDVCDSGDVQCRGGGIAVEFVLVECPGTLDGSAFEEDDEEARDRPGEYEGERDIGEPSHPLVHEDAEVEEAYAGFACGHGKRVYQVDNP